MKPNQTEHELSQKNNKVQSEQNIIHVVMGLK